MNTILSKDRLYRYTLYRDASVFDRHLLPAVHEPQQGPGGILMFIGLNPSTADEKTDDQTIRICRGYAKAWGYSHLCMTNLYAYRETSPHAMMLAPDPVGPENDFYLMQCAVQAGCIIACWGSWASGGRVKAVLEMLNEFDIHVLKLNDNGTPHHPLRMAKVDRPYLWIPCTQSKSPATT